MTDGRQDPMPLDREVPANLEMVHPQLGFGVLEHPLDPPGGDGFRRADAVFIPPRVGSRPEAGQ